jgi:hypothetical protein
MAKLNLDLTAVVEKGSSEFTYHDPGEYQSTIVAAEVKDTKTGGAMLVISHKTEKGMTAQRINIKNSNPKAVEIGLSELKSLLISINHKNPSGIGDTDELINGKCRIVIADDVQDDGKKYSRITMTKKCEQTPAPQTNAKAPWMK